MLRPFLAIAMLSPGRQRTFRTVAAAHVVFLAAAAYVLTTRGVQDGPTVFGYVCVALGLVEGAALVGWRLTQLPKSQALEFLLASPVQPRRVFLAEAAAGLGRFALVWLAGLPVFLAMVLTGCIDPADAWPVAVLPFVGGCAAAMLLTAWVYEPLAVRRVGEAVALLGVLAYLVVGVLAGENLVTWLKVLPPWLGEFLYAAITGGYAYNPFGVVQYWYSRGAVGWIAMERFWWVLGGAGVVFVAAGLRAASRLKGHFHDRHYGVKQGKRKDETSGRRASRRSSPFSLALLPFDLRGHLLSLWAVRRVSEYSGRVNLWLAGGFAAVYGAYLVAGDAWPPWCGRLVFQLFDQWGGAATVACGLCVLAIVPAVFQYGLWDSTVPGRCKRLELLLLTDLAGADYWRASLAAAWARGWGYLASAVVLWAALAVGGHVPWYGAVAALVGGAALWAFGFAVGFRSFATGRQTSGLASAFTLGGPLLLVAVLKAGGPTLAGFVPHGLCYLPVAGGLTWSWAACLTLTLATTAWLTRTGLKRCDADLRKWYDANQGTKTIV